MGIDKFIMKPIVKDELANAIRTVLDTPKARPNFSDSAFKVGC